MDILQLIEELEEVMDDASSIPFSKRVSVDPDEVFEIIKEIRSSLPEEIRQAKWVNDEKERILSEAHEEAGKLVQQAKQQAKEMDEEGKRRFNELVSESNITREAQRQGQEIVSKAKGQAKEIKEGIFSYVDEILSNTQGNLQSIVNELDKNRQELK